MLMCVTRGCNAGHVMGWGAVSLARDRLPLPRCCCSTTVTRCCYQFSPLSSPLPLLTLLLLLLLLLLLIMLLMLSLSALLLLSLLLVFPPPGLLLFVLPGEVHSCGEAYCCLYSCHYYFYFYLLLLPFIH